MSHFSVEMAARMYRIPLIDYARGTPLPNRRRGVLLGSGAGLMTALMDQVPARWCLDTDDLRADPSAPYRVGEFIEMAHAAPDGGVALAGWFSISKPDYLRAAFNRLRPDGLVYAGATPLGCAGEVSNLDEFIETAWSMWAPGVPLSETW